LAAGALSRINPLMQIQSFPELTPLWIQEAFNTYATNPHAQELLAQLTLVASPNTQGYSLHQGIIRQGGQIWIGDNLAVRTKLISTFHSTVLGGHSGIHATYQRIKKLFVWKDIKIDVENFVKQCTVCQHA
jgi:hypothetical protein